MKNRKTKRPCRKEIKRKNKRRQRSWKKKLAKLKQKQEGNPRIITDTNIWYYIGANDELFEKTKKMNLTPNFINLEELTHTENLVFKQKENIRKGIQRIMYHQKNVIFEPPYIKVAQLINKFPFDTVKLLRTLLKVSRQIANGGVIDESLNNDFISQLRINKKPKQETTDSLNKRAVEIRGRLSTPESRKKHMEEDSIPYTSNWLNNMVLLSTDNKCNIENLELDQVELYIHSLDRFLKEVETGQIDEIKVNDWFDIELLAYVRPGDKYWTKEKRWKGIIERAGCGHYLFDDSEL